MEKENARAFLKGYWELCKKHNLFIGGCGCCGSPFIDEGEPDMYDYLVETNLVARKNNLSDEEEMEIIKRELWTL